MLGKDRRVGGTHPVQLDGIDPLVAMFWVLSPEIPHAIIDTDVQTALVKLVRLQRKRERILIRLIICMT